MSAPDPKRRRPVRLSWPKYRALEIRVFEQTGGLCFCGCGRRANSCHHLVGGRGEREDVEENLVALAGDGTRLCHGALTSACRTFEYDSNGVQTVVEPESVRQGVRVALERFPEKLAYIIDRKGAAWLERTYGSAS